MRDWVLTNADREQSQNAMDTMWLCYILRTNYPYFKYFFYCECVGVIFEYCLGTLNIYTWNKVFQLRFWKKIEKQHNLYCLKIHYIFAWVGMRPYGDYISEAFFHRRHHLWKHPLILQCDIYPPWHFWKNILQNKYNILPFT